MRRAGYQQEELRKFQEMIPNRKRNAHTTNYRLSAMNR